MKTIKKNESFLCIHCKKNVPIHPHSSRNHCPFCLYSLHVDKDVPGDRLSECGGVMEPRRILPHPKKHQQIEFICSSCGAKHMNILAPDDDQDLIIALVKKTNEETL